MSAPVIDAEAMAEFLDKAESMVSNADCEHWNRVLTLRSQSVLMALRDPEQSLRVVPATARINSEQKETWREVEAPIREAVEKRPEEVIDILSRFGASPWLWEWGTFWLANAFPEDYVWWSRWMYRPDTKTGSIALVVTDPGCLTVEPPLLYSQILQAGHFAEQVLEGWRRPSFIEPPFRHTVALAMVYAVYLFTLSSWRLTDEFTQVLPPFPKVVANLLGISRWEGYTVAKSKSH
ncbi:MAG: hypothetical protein M1493_00345 [Firmicutes bacterium]|jgi:hypothetical protein|uniref:Uncharacterized protein n=1 Tax=Sulfobacillus benefaciens TaxID=453960 RepID=A0A2T2XBD9_9FIRM|nr:hypothetical protein [Bacillota bacterium]PSR31815.1 MAG: hypothetical protein C7B43_00925 [Sulfobacillus benefaciens]HBQ93889.1 hypothetical protein [Sulfobacillus sp.]